MLKNKNIIVALTGSIAAYKAAELVRLIKKSGAEVRIIMTDAAKEFITPITMQALSGNPIHSNLLDMEAEAAMGHIELAKWADAIVVSPCSANTLAKISQGLGSDLLTAVILASEAKVFLAPAMNQQMWNAQITQENVVRASSLGHKILGPGEGEQACGDIGSGRMLEPEEIFAALEAFSLSLLGGKKVLITAGPTQEPIDPVRYLSNHSSGKMGYALAEAAEAAGASVTLVSGPVNLRASSSIEVIDVVTAKDMFAEVKRSIEAADIFIGCAAVADYSPLNTHSQKIKKNLNENLLLELEPNPDILKFVSENYSNKTIIGFSAETENVEDFAREKLVAKNLDFIVANDVSRNDIAFNAAENEVLIISKDKTKALAKASKILVAHQILNYIHQDSLLH
jgi:phosphopantothenoylcysteine decarboxylase/phosphopantothenate--cysteine ligase|tara:strand:- start:2498 stop:3691 length:1194 start_codon:yes stop_codon:yes gene_type:complete